MELILSSITTACVNLLVFSFIPFLWWFFRHRKETSFFKWLGFIQPQLKSKWWTLLLFAVVYYFFIPLILLSGFHRKPWNTWKTAVPFP